MILKIVYVVLDDVTIFDVAYIFDPLGDQHEPVNSVVEKKQLCTLC